MGIGDKIKFNGERTRYTVQGFDDRFVIATKPHFKTYLYTIIDKQRRIRGPINMIFGPPEEVNNPEGAEEVLRFMREDDGGHHVWGVSYRNNVPVSEEEMAQVMEPDQ